MSRQRRAPRVTLADVAEAAGVSVTTASFVLSGRSDMRIATATVDRVVEAARVLNYARVPRTAGSVRQLPVIGLVTDTVASDHFAGEMIRGGVTAAAERGHAVVTGETEGDRPLETRVVRELVNRGVEHFIYAALSTRTVTVPKLLVGRRTVLLNCVDPGSSTPAVVPDEHAAGALAVQSLLDLGHSDHIWVVGEITGGPYAGRDRFAALADTLAEHGLRVDRHVSCRWWPPEAHRATLAALQGAFDQAGPVGATVPAAVPTAVVALNDRVAMGVYQAAIEVGLRIPADLSVVSFDNSELAWWLTPPLSSVGLPYVEMGRRAVEVLLDGPAEKEDRSFEGEGAGLAGGPVEVLAMPLHARASLAPPRG